MSAASTPADPGSLGGHPPAEPSEPVPFSPMVPGKRSLLRLTLRPTLSAWLRLRVDGVEHVPDSGPVLVASTHRSHADSIALATAIPRPVHFLGDQRLTAWPVMGPQLPRLGMVPLRRGEADASAMDVLSILLEDGACIAVYPEGSRSRDGRVHRLRSGVARLAAKHQVPVVPAAVIGIGQRWPIGQRPRVTGPPVTVRFGPAMPAPAGTPRSRRAFNDELQGTLATLVGAELAGDFSPFHGGEGAGGGEGASA